MNNKLAYIKEVNCGLYEVSFLNDDNKQIIYYKGEKGEQGFTGKPGATPTINIKGTNTVPYTEPASVVNDGITPNAYLTFNIPQGRPGLQGERGATGPKGDKGECCCKHHNHLGPWSSAKTYPLTLNDCKISVSYSGNIYENLINGNLNNTPTEHPTKWNKIF